MTQTGTIPNVPVHALLELHFTMGYINRLAATVNVDDPSLTPNADELDGQTLETAVLQRTHFSQCRCGVMVICHWSHVKGAAGRRCAHHLWL